MMLESRKKDEELLEEDSLVEEEIEEPLEEEEAESESLSIAERRARRRAKRAQKDTVDDSDSNITVAKEAPTRKQRDALKAREREALAFYERIPLLGSLFSYLRDVVTEIKKVTWPTRDEAQRLTTIVVAVTVLFAIILGAIDLFYGWWFQQGVESTTTFLVVAVPFFAIAGGLTWFFIIREQE